jgi:uncharacterized membrane protein YfcA
MFAEDGTVLAVLVVAMLAGGLVKGVIGVALPMVSIAILSSVVDVHLALGLITIPILLTNVWQAFYAGRALEVLRRFWLPIACLMVSIWLGTNLVVRLPAAALYGIIGAVVVVFTSTSYFTPHWSLPERYRTPAGVAVSIFSGVLGGLSTIWGPPLVMYFVTIRLPKEEFIRTTGFFWFAASLPLVAGYLRNGVLNADNAALSAAAVVPSFAGLWLGQWLRGRIEQETFRRVLLIGLCFVGLNLIRRAVF